MGEYQKRYRVANANFNSQLAIKHDLINPELPYFDAIVAFNRATTQPYVPNDILYSFISGLRLIQSAATKYKFKNEKNKSKLKTIHENEDEEEEDDAMCNDDVQLSADDLFPILVWIMVHCRIDDIHLRLGYLDKFLDENVKFFGEVGMCLSLVQAAAEFIRKKEGWHFGLDEELDKETSNATNAKKDQDANDEIVV